MAEGILRARLTDRAPDVGVSSAGLMLQGHSAEPHAVKVMSRAGVDISNHRSRVVGMEMLEKADLIIGMERRHVREVSALSVDVFRRSFTLPELVMLAEKQGPRSGTDLGAWVAELGRGRNALEYLRDSSAEEVADPMGASLRRFKACAREIEDLIDRFVPLAWPGSNSVQPPSPPHNATPRSL